MKKEQSYIKYLIITVILALVIIGIYLFNNNGEEINLEENKDLSQNEIPAELIDLTKDFSKLSVEFTANLNDIKETSSGVKYTTDPSKIRGGGPPKGGIGFDRGIPALDEGNIKYVSVSDADKWIEDNELVLALEHNNVKRVYPLQIITWHEIVNDIVGGSPILLLNSSSIIKPYN